MVHLTSFLLQGNSFGSATFNGGEASYDMGGRNNILPTSIDHTLLDIFQKYGYYVF